MNLCTKLSRIALNKRNIVLKQHLIKFLNDFLYHLDAYMLCQDPLGCAQEVFVR